MVKACPAKCSVSEWTLWSPCDKACGIGSKTRKRMLLSKVKDDSVCPALKETKECQIELCPKACSVSSWSQWGECTKSCGGGSQQKQRSVLIPAKFGGDECGDLEIKRSCNTQPCDSKCRVSLWGMWSKCDKNCGGGIRKRQRKALTPTKDGCGLLEESEKCNAKPCPVDCKLSQWAAYGECSGTCGLGQMVHRREVETIAAHGGKACGILEQAKDCTLPPCPLACEVSQWMGWSQCDKLCSGGKQLRERKVVQEPVGDGNECPTLKEKRLCNTKICPVDCVTARWGSWSTCSLKCGGGKESRIRKVLTKPIGGGRSCGLVETARPCNTQPCPVPCKLSQWTPWAECSRPCGTGSSTRTRRVVDDLRHGGTCGTLSEVKECNKQGCPRNCIMGEWGSFSKCSKVCGGGVRKRSRLVKEESSNGGKACGLGVDYAKCNLTPCSEVNVVQTVKELSEKINKTSAQLNMTAKDSAVESNRTKAAKQEAADTTRLYAQSEQTLDRMKVKLKESNTLAEKLKIQVREALKQQHPNMHEILDLAATAKTLHGKAKRKVVLQIGELAKEAAESKPKIDSSDVDVVRNEEKEAEAEEKEARGRLDVEISNLKALKKKSLQAEKAIKSSVWKELNLKHMSAHLKSELSRDEETRNMLAAVKLKPKKVPGKHNEKEEDDDADDDNDGDDAEQEETKTADIKKKMEEVVKAKAQEVEAEAKTVSEEKSRVEAISSGEGGDAKEQMQKEEEEEEEEVNEEDKTVSEEQKQVVELPEGDAEATEEVEEKLEDEVEAKDEEVKKEEKAVIKQKSQVEAMPSGQVKEEMEEVVEVKENKVEEEEEAVVEENKQVASIKPEVKAAQKEVTEKAKKKAVTAAKQADLKVAEMKKSLSKAEKVERVERKKLGMIGKVLVNMTAVSDKARQASAFSRQAADKRNRTVTAELTSLQGLDPALALKLRNGKMHTLFYNQTVGNATNGTGKVNQTIRTVASAAEDAEIAQREADAKSQEAHTADGGVQQLSRRDHEQKTIVQRAQLAVGVAQKSVEMATETALLRKQEADCIGVHKDCNAFLSTMQKEVHNKVKKLQAEMTELASEMANTYKMKCGDGKFQNENGEQCDDGNSKPDDGCDKNCQIEKGWSCAGGSWLHESVCDKCGNGKLRASEECDDGNSYDGDGCSKACTIEENFMCSSQRSVEGIPLQSNRSQGSACSPLDDNNKDALNSLDVAYHKCRESGKMFLAQPGQSGDHQCIEKSALENSLVAGTKQRTGFTVHGSAGSGVLGNVALRLTCPMPLAAHPGLSPFAVCAETRYGACQHTAGRKHVCNMHKVLTCEEVCAAPRFCESEALGVLVERQYGSAHTPTGRACCFKHCKVPKSWSSEAQVIDPTTWCLPFAHDL